MLIFFLSEIMFVVPQYLIRNLAIKSGKFMVDFMQTKMRPKLLKLTLSIGYTTNNITGKQMI